MSGQAERSQKVSQWLEHLRSWRQSGRSVSAYAAGHGLAASAMYHWRRVLIREGHWPKRTGSTTGRGAAGRVSATPLRFARVAVTDSVRPTPVIVRIILGNGRRAEIELTELGRLSEVLGMLERRA